MDLYNYSLEIKSRFLLLVFTWVVFISVSYIFKEVLLYLFVSRIYVSGFCYFIFTDVVEVFTSYVFLIFFLSNQVLFLFIFYHLLVFTLPSLTKSESNFFICIFITSSFLFFLSIIVFNSILFPMSLSFFLSFNHFEKTMSLNFYFEAKLLEYLIFYFKFYYMCFFYFQVFLFPILFFKFVNSELRVYASFRKFLYCFFVFFSTILTPPDVFSQVVLSFSIVISCEFLVYGFTFKNVLRKLFFN